MSQNVSSQHVSSHHVSSSPDVFGFLARNELEGRIRVGTRNSLWKIVRSSRNGTLKWKKMNQVWLSKSTESSAR